MKRRILLLSALALLGASVTPAMAADKIVVKIAGMKPDGEPETIGMKLFAKYVMEGTKGKYDVRVFPNSQLGKEDAYIAQTRKGIIQMCATGTQTSSLHPAMAMLETPMLYDSLEHAHRAMNGETFKLINKGFAEKSGLTTMNAFPLGFRHFYTTSRISPAVSPASWPVASRTSAWPRCTVGARPWPCWPSGRRTSWSPTCACPR